jgi:hypothetical protein
MRWLLENKFKVLIALAGFSGAFAIYSYAAVSYRIEPSVQYFWNTWQQVNEHGVCRRYINDTSYGVLVPTNTDAEWAAFRANSGAQIYSGACDACSPMQKGAVANGDTCTLIERSTDPAHWASAEACAARCTAMGAVVCSWLPGSGDFGCYSWSGGSCNRIGHSLWHAAQCTP